MVGRDSVKLSSGNGQESTLQDTLLNDRVNLDNRDLEKEIKFMKVRNDKDMATINESVREDTEGRTETAVHAKFEPESGRSFSMKNGNAKKIIHSFGDEPITRKLNNKNYSLINSNAHNEEDVDSSRPY